MMDNYMARAIYQEEILCGYCNGRQKVLELDGDGNEGFVVCPDCNGDGTIVVDR